jgi:hypothetical protein
MIGLESMMLCNASVSKIDLHRELIVSDVSGYVLNRIAVLTQSTGTKYGRKPEKRKRVTKSSESAKAYVSTNKYKLGGVLKTKSDEKSEAESSKTNEIVGNSYLDDELIRSSLMDSTLVQNTLPSSNSLKLYLNSDGSAEKLSPSSEVAYPQANSYTSPLIDTNCKSCLVLP